MTQGRKSKTVLALSCALALLLAGAILPALAGAQETPAGEEYDLVLPQGDGGAGGPDASQPPTDSGDGGGATFLLLLLAAVAALCTGLAVWRLRRGSNDDDGGPGRPSTTNVTSEQQPL
jgi:hypothetical protein